MSVRLEPTPGCVAPLRGTGCALVGSDEPGEWWASWQGFARTRNNNECVSVACTTKDEAVQWALSQPASEWLIRREDDPGEWDHLR